MLIFGKVFYQDKTAVPNEVLADGFSTIFESKYEDVIKDLNSSSSVVTIAKKIESDQKEKLESWMKEKNITAGINIDEDTTRVYPFNNLASHLIGICGSDNQGLEGLESEWDDVLRGTSGRIVTTTDVHKNSISDESEQYVPAENGSDIYLTIDANVQSIAEKYLKQAVKDNKADSGIVLMMDPNDGDILAMANYPNFDLNNPFEPNTDELKKKWDKLSKEDQSKQIYAMWRNPAVSDGYEPGSTFKLVTSSIALEEGLFDTDKSTFTCKRVISVNGVEMHCWASHAHGALTLRGGLENSCNPFFIQLGRKIGKTRFYKYLDAYGLRETTGAKVAGEVPGNFLDIEKMGNVELATMSYGQRFTITPLQLITTVSCIVNDGKLMQPRIVYKTVNSDTGVTTTIDPVEKRQVISEETSEKIRSMLRSVVTDGTGGYAEVTGYEVGGKSGTSEPLASRLKIDGYTASFIAVTPIDNPQVVCLVILKHPRAGSHQGGTIAAPVASQILSKALPALGIASTKATSSKKNLITVSDVTGISYKDAEKRLKKAGFTVVNLSKSDDYTIVNQYPKAGVSLEKGGVICLYDDKAEPKMVKVPNLKGLGLSNAKSKLEKMNLNIEVDGSGTVISQDISEGTKVEEGTIVSVKCKKSGHGGQ